MLTPKNFWLRQVVLVIVFFGGLGVFYFGAIVVNALIELYAWMWGTSVHTWINATQKWTYKGGVTYTDSHFWRNWPDWAKKDPIRVVFTVWPLLVAADVFQTCLRLLTGKLFPPSKELKTEKKSLSGADYL